MKSAVKYVINVNNNIAEQLLVMYETNLHNYEPQPNSKSSLQTPHVVTEWMHSQKDQLMCLCDRRTSFTQFKNITWQHQKKKFCCHEYLRRQYLQ